MTKHMTGTRKDWLAARIELLKAEKEHTRRGEPVLPCPGHVLRHCCTPFVVTIRWLSVTR